MTDDKKTPPRSDYAHLAARLYLSRYANVSLAESADKDLDELEAACAVVESMLRQDLARRVPEAPTDTADLAELRRKAAERDVLLAEIGKDDVAGALDRLRATAATLKTLDGILAVFDEPDAPSNEPAIVVRARVAVDLKAKGLELVAQVARLEDRNRVQYDVLKTTIKTIARHLGKPDSDDLREIEALAAAAASAERTGKAMWADMQVQREALLASLRGYRRWAAKILGWKYSDGDMSSAHVRGIAEEGDAKAQQKIAEMLTAGAKDKAERDGFAQGLKASEDAYSMLSRACENATAILAGKNPPAVGNETPLEVMAREHASDREARRAAERVLIEAGVPATATDEPYIVRLARGAVAALQHEQLSKQAAPGRRFLGWERVSLRVTSINRELLLASGVVERFGTRIHANDPWTEKLELPVPFKVDLATPATCTTGPAVHFGWEEWVAEIVASHVRSGAIDAGLPSGDLAMMRERWTGDGSRLDLSRLRTALAEIPTLTPQQIVDAAAACIVEQRQRIKTQAALIADFNNIATVRLQGAEAAATEARGYVTRIREALGLPEGSDLVDCIHKAGNLRKRAEMKAEIDMLRRGAAAELGALTSAAGVHADELEGWIKWARRQAAEVDKLIASERTATAEASRWRAAMKRVASDIGVERTTDSPEDLEDMCKGAWRAQVLKYGAARPA